MIASIRHRATAARAGARQRSLVTQCARGDGGGWGLRGFCLQAVEELLGLLDLGDVVEGAGVGDLEAAHACRARGSRRERSRGERVRVKENERERERKREREREKERKGEKERERRGKGRRLTRIWANGGDGHVENGQNNQTRDEPSTETPEASQQT